MKARELIVAPRLPKLAGLHTGNPFTTLGHLVVDCAFEGCGWHAMGPRADMKKAIDDHQRLYHSQDVGVILLNQPRQ